MLRVNREEGCKSIPSFMCCGVVASSQIVDTFCCAGAIPMSKSPTTVCKVPPANLRCCSSCHKLTPHP